MTDRAAESLGSEYGLVENEVVMVKDSFQKVHEPSGGVAQVPSDHVPEAVRDGDWLWIRLFMVVGSKGAWEADVSTDRS